jgi:hypothetical protein
MKYILKNLSDLFRPMSSDTGSTQRKIFFTIYVFTDRLSGLEVRVLGYRSGGPGSIPGTTRFSEKRKKERKQ